MEKTNIRDRRARRSGVTTLTTSSELYDTLGVEKFDDDGDTNQYAIVHEQVSTESKSRKRPLTLVDYDYQSMAIDYSKPNTAQQLGNYRQAMDFLGHIKLTHHDEIITRLKKIIYDYPNVDISTFVNKENSILYSWVVGQLERVLGEKYMGSVYVLGGGMGLMGAMLLDSKLRFENIRSFDINGTAQFLADEFMQKELLMDWRFKSTTQDLFDVDYAKHNFISRLPDGTLSKPFSEIPGTIINTNVSYIKNYKDWYDMIPDIRRVVVVGESGENVPYPFANSQSFNSKFPMSFELYTGVLTIDGKQYFMKIGHK